MEAPGSNKGSKRPELCGEPPVTEPFVSGDGRGYGAAASVTAPSKDASGSASTRTIGRSSAE